jgi:hypothetical protein
MNDFQLGTNLRRQILADLQRGQASDGRRLQALVGDFCGEAQSNLLPALKYLVLTPAFNNAVGQSPPLVADPRLQLRLNQELEQVFAPAICARMNAVVSGLLNLSEGTITTGPVPTGTVPTAPAPTVTTASSTTAGGTTPSPTSAAPTSAFAAPPPPPSTISAIPAIAEPAAIGSSRSSGRGVVALLSFIAGVLLVGVGGVLVWLLLLSRQQQTLIPPTEVTPIQESPAERQQPSESLIPPAAPDLGQPVEQPDEQAQRDQAVATVEQLYTALSSRNIEEARQLFGGTAADQFEPSFFEQFQEVRVAELRETSRTGTTVNLMGVVTFLYPDGSSQSETRSFSVDTASVPAVITASAFGQVVKPRN